MSNLAINAALKANNFLNLINIYSQNIFDNINMNSDLNGTIIAGSQNVWNNLPGRYRYILLQNNTSNACFVYAYTYSSDSQNIDKSLIFNNNAGIRVSINYRE